MSRPLYRPTPRQAVCLAAIGAGRARLWLLHALPGDRAIRGRHRLRGDGANWLCASRRTAIALFTPQVFGIVALGAALLNLLRPSVVFWALALLAGGAGIVLYNAALSALAVALLILSLARPVPEAS